MTYRVLTHSRRIEKDFLRIITDFSEGEQNTIWQILRFAPKGSGKTHWTIKKVDRDIWQLDSLNLSPFVGDQSDQNA